METDVTGTCRPVPFVFQCPLPFELFLLLTVLTKESLPEKEQISSNLVLLASPKGQNLLNATGNVRISCDTKVSGEKLVVKWLSSLSLKLFSLEVQISTGSCSIIFLTSLFWLHFFFSKCRFHLLLEFRTCQRALSSRWFYRTLGEWKLNIILEAVHYHQGGVRLLSVLAVFECETGKGELRQWLTSLGPKALFALNMEKNWSNSFPAMFSVVLVQFSTS